MMNSMLMFCSHIQSIYITYTFPSNLTNNETCLELNSHSDTLLNFKFYCENTQFTVDAGSFTQFCQCCPKLKRISCSLLPTTVCITLLKSKPNLILLELMGFLYCTMFEKKVFSGVDSHDVQFYNSLTSGS